MKRSQKVLLGLITLAVGALVYFVGYAAGYTNGAPQMYQKGYENGIMVATKAILVEMKRTVETSERAKFDLPR